MSDHYVPAPAPVAFLLRWIDESPEESKVVELEHMQIFEANTKATDLSTSQ